MAYLDFKEKLLMKENNILSIENAVSGDRRYHVNKSYLDSPKRFGKIKLYQIGRLYCGEKTKIGTHAHAGAYEITVVTEGKGKVYANGVGVDVERGDIFLSFPFDFHAIDSDSASPLKYDFFAFTVEDARMVAELKRIEEGFMPAESRIVRDEKIAYLVRNAISEFDKSDDYFDQVLETIFVQIVIYIIRCFGNSVRHVMGSGATNAEILCYQIMNYIDTHVYDLRDLSSLSDVTNYNYSYLSSLFCRVTGETLSEYFRNRRLETARFYIEENKKSITEISEMINYSSIYTFSRAFKEKYGVSPAEYRKKNVR